MLCSLLCEAQGSLANGSSTLWLSHLTVVKHTQEHQSTTNLQVSLAILCALVSPWTLPELVFLMGRNNSTHKPEDLSMKISLVEKPDEVTIWAIFTEWSVNTVFSEVSLEVNPAVVSQPVTNLNLRPFCNSMKEVTECHFMACKIFKTSKASTTTKQHINTVFITIYAQDVQFFPQGSQSILITSDTCATIGKSRQVGQQHSQVTQRNIYPWKQTILSLLCMCKPHTPLTKQELYFWIKKYTSMYTVN